MKSARVTVRDFASQLKTLTEENKTLRINTETIREKYALSKAKLREMQEKLTASKTDATRIRQLRDRYRENTRTLEDQNKALRTELKQATQNQLQDPYDSDDEEPTRQG